MPKTPTLPFLADMKMEQIILCFHGKLNNEMIQYFIKIMDLNLIQCEVRKVQRRRIISVMIESLQNVIHYNARLQEEANEVEQHTYFIFYHSSTGQEAPVYRLLVSNPVKEAHIQNLKARLETIKKQAVDSLHEEQLKILEHKSVKADENQHHGAGIGLIDMARRCYGNFDYNFYDFNNNFKYFTIQFVFNGQV
ncbi:MAG: hypothetical protein KatS3mg033_0389 [Thermonema sp.]|uniref:SiaB family protein kinase n=1 Tax=Thermonema sp. TaxID=2231181 RepID=UPI0021DE54B2|nr:SiaB family protein kinase [Thermonema sp.]GIV38589.1 MAG: hypothetical protein KatS3mg033_0389 [Thermonema sp.]